MNTKPRVARNITRKGKRLGRPSKHTALLAPSAPSEPQRTPRGRPKKESLTTLEIIYSELGKRPGFAKQLTEELARPDQPAGERVVRTVASTKRHLDRISKRRESLTGIDATPTKPEKS